MSEKPAPSRRGRPPKYGRPARLLALTLPVDVIAWLKTINPDPAWALVALYERANRRAREPQALAELVALPQRRALIMVNTDALKSLAGVAVIPMAEGRGILALEPGRTVADLELAVIDRLEAPGVTQRDREVLVSLRERLREWRREGVRFEARSIIVAHRAPQAPGR